MCRNTQSPHKINFVYSQKNERNKIQYIYYIINHNAIIMENNSALNGATTKDQAWKTKKGYGPMVVVATLLLGLAYRSGQMSGSTGAGSTRGAAASASMLQAFDSTPAHCNGRGDFCAEDADCCGSDICIGVCYGGILFDSTTPAHCNGKGDFCADDADCCGSVTCEGGNCHGGIL